MSTRRSSLVASLALGIGLLAAHPGDAQAQAAPRIDGYSLLQTTRVTRTVSRFTYRAVLVNPLGQPLSGVRATLVGAGPRTAILDAVLEFPVVSAGGTAVSSDTFAIEHDRTAPFNPATLQWTLAYTPVSAGPHVIGQDDTRAATVHVGPAGATLTTTSATGAVYTLAIPADAVPSGTAISITPVHDIANLPLTDGLVAAVRIHPDGLQLQRPATLTIEMPGPFDASTLLGFLFDDAGTTFEVLPAIALGSRLTIAVKHFSTAGVASAVQADFVAQMTALLQTLPDTLSPRQTDTLVATMFSWIQRFGFSLCEGTTLCTQVIEIARQTYESHGATACADSAARLQAGNPFAARLALASVLDVATGLYRLHELARDAGIGDFTPTLDLSCVDTQFRAIARVTRQQMLTQPRGALLVMILEMWFDARELALFATANAILAEFDAILQAILTRATSEQGLCDTDPDAGEALLLLAPNSVGEGGLTLANPEYPLQFTMAWIGCRIHVSPRAPTTGEGESFTFTGSAPGLSPPTVTWTIPGTDNGATLGVATGAFKAGAPAAVVVRVDSVAEPTRFKLVTVTVRPVQVTVSPTSASVEAGRTRDLDATVTGAQNAAVTWSIVGAASGHSIDANGLFSAGPRAGSVTVRATHPASGRFGQATIVVQPRRTLPAVARLTGRIGMASLYTRTSSTNTSQTVPVGNPPVSGVSQRTVADTETASATAETFVEIDVSRTAGHGLVRMISSSLEGIHSRSTVDTARLTFTDCFSIATQRYDHTYTHLPLPGDVTLGIQVWGTGNYTVSAGYGLWSAGRVRIGTSVQSTCPAGSGRDMSHVVPGVVEQPDGGRQSPAGGNFSRTGTFSLTQPMVLTGSHTFEEPCGSGCTKIVTVSWDLREQ